MAKSATPKTLTTPLNAYLKETSDLRLSLLLVLPLLLIYEGAMAIAQVPVRNSAEVAVLHLFDALPWPGPTAVRLVIFAVLIIALTVLASGRRIKAGRIPILLGESFVLALVLGPLLGWMLDTIGLSNGMPVQGSAPLWHPLLLSVGAGVWEELVFRLGLLGGITFICIKVFRIGKPESLVLAIVISSLAFALYHHAGLHGEPIVGHRFAFRAIAGTILGILFVLRGLAVVVYMHVFYDLLVDIQNIVD